MKESKRESNGRFTAGNQFAVGNHGGRPRTVTPSDEEIEELGKEMVEWVEKNNPIHLSNWYYGQKMMLWDEFKCYRDNSVFFRYYLKAQNLVGQQYLLKDSRIDHGIKSHFCNIYFHDKKEMDEHFVRLKAQATKQAEAASKAPIVNVIHYGDKRPEVTVDDNTPT